MGDAAWQRMPVLRPLSPDQFCCYRDTIVQRHGDHLPLTQRLLGYHLLRLHADAGGAGLGPRGGPLRRAPLREPQREPEPVGARGAPHAVGKHDAGG